MKIIGSAGESYGLKVRSSHTTHGVEFQGVIPLPLNTQTVPGSESGSKNPLPGGLAAHQNDEVVGVAAGCGGADTLCICGHPPGDHTERMGCLANRGDCPCDGYTLIPVCVLGAGCAAPVDCGDAQGCEARERVAGYVPPIVTPAGNVLDLLASAGCRGRS